MDFERAMLSYVDEDQKTGVHRLFDKLCEFYDDLFAALKSIINVIWSYSTTMGHPARAAVFSECRRRDAGSVSETDCRFLPQARHVSGAALLR
jgi:hypothetical protein